MSDVMTYALEDGIATITMDDGKVNVLGIPMLRELQAAFDRAEEDHAVVILTGREGRFSAGFDLKVFSETPEQLPEMLTLGANLCKPILTFPRPVITACTGHGVAAGLNAEAHKATKLKSRAGLIDAVQAAIEYEFKLAAWGGDRMTRGGLIKPSVPTICPQRRVGAPSRARRPSQEVYSRGSA